METAARPTNLFDRLHDVERSLEATMRSQARTIGALQGEGIDGKPETHASDVVALLDRITEKAATCMKYADRIEHVVGAPDTDAEPVSMLYADRHEGSRLG